MAKLTDLILTFQKYFNAHGDMQVVYRDKDNKVVDLLSSGLSYADNINDEKIKVCWISDQLTHVLEPNVSNTPIEPTSITSEEAVSILMDSKS